MSPDNAALEQLSALLDEKLSADEARVVEERLDSSDEQQELHASLAAARRVLRSTPAPAMPEGLLARIQAEAHAEMSHTVSIWDRWRVPVGAIAVAAAVLLAVFAPWQTLNRADVSEVGPPAAPVTVVAEGPVDEPADTPAHALVDEVAVAEAAVTAGAADVSEGLVAARPAETGRRIAVVGSPKRSVVRPAVRPAAEVQETPATDETEKALMQEPVTPIMPELASAPRSIEPSVADAEPMLSDASQPTFVAAAPRTTIDVEPSLGQAAPSALEVEMAVGVVAGMLIDQFVAEHMVESSATMLSVVTDMPTSELGPALARDEDETSSFGFSFTDAMRRALTESENQLP